MYPTLIGITFAANITVICPCLCLFNIIWWHNTSGWTFFFHPWNSPIMVHE